MRFSALTAAVLLAAPSIAGAQSVGLGPRFSLVRGDAEAGTSADRYTGGLLRARLSDRASLELSLDYRSYSDEVLNRRVKEYPFQGSLLVYPVRASFSPYLLGGVGWYSQRIEALVGDEFGVTRRPFGYHAGLGGEIQLGRHAAIHLDYRYTFMRNGDGDADQDGGGFSIPGISVIADQLRVSHEGSMWTGGLTIYF